VDPNFTNPSNLENKEHFESMLTLKRDPNMWNLFFDGSKSLEGESVGCILKYPTGNKTLITRRLEFQCKNKTAKYEALLHGLREAIELGENKINEFGDSQIVIRHVRKKIHCLSIHFNNYQQKVWEFLKSFDAFNINHVLEIKCRLSSQCSI
jgi:ribonuclease HI